MPKIYFLIQYYHLFVLRLPLAILSSSFFGLQRVFRYLGNINRVMRTKPHIGGKNNKVLNKIWFFPCHCIYTLIRLTETVGHLVLRKMTQQIPTIRHKSSMIQIAAKRFKNSIKNNHSINLNFYSKKIRFKHIDNLSLRALAPGYL